MLWGINPDDCDGLTLCVPGHSDPQQLKVLHLFLTQNAHMDTVSVPGPQAQYKTTQLHLLLGLLLLSLLHTVSEAAGLQPLI